jgi:hypothetical protein
MRIAQIFEAYFKLAISATAKSINMLSDQAAQQIGWGRFNDAKDPHRVQLEQFEGKSLQNLASSSSKVVC